ncbi:hypothetical protein [Pseudomonas aeruginosa]|uniref:hypothetical protein n=1 Tax=Pseudomonas aeruginosa TaxID=287 RepID=UPI00193B25C1|nr:hypothetical protein [Pseudomonas aeruginosa]MBM2631713.1 hypothetical protein [Pseudomonas aeruginosa]MBM2644398.1 hypothetical protein [Pseudomonas aeruginosa]MBM2690253.1 hypothetical protein [Pseudomonas aeruginosa]MBM2696705.1 hypothetical protein [Pseudomonas aeruginosa]MBM2703101.1 hypothetical protein [Pseudomonas aeruginosa]
MSLITQLETLLASVNNLMGVIDGKLRNKANKVDVYTRTDLEDPLRTLGANAATASKLKVARLLTLAGEATGEVGFDGSGNVTLMVTVPGLQEKANVGEVVTPEQMEARFNHLIGAAPEALNQLEEFANALGQDPNFAATMLAKLAEKADKATTYTVTQTDDKFLLKTGKAADAALLGGNAPAYYASAASVTALEASVGDAFNRLATAFNTGANNINAI